MRDIIWNNLEVHQDELNDGAIVNLEGKTSQFLGYVILLYKSQQKVPDKFISIQIPDLKNQLKEYVNEGYKYYNSLHGITEGELYELECKVYHRYFETILNFSHPSTNYKNFNFSFNKHKVMLCPICKKNFPK